MKSLIRQFLLGIPVAFAVTLIEFGLGINPDFIHKLFIMLGVVIIIQIPRE